MEKQMTIKRIPFLATIDLLVLVHNFLKKKMI